MDAEDPDALISVLTSAGFKKCFRRKARKTIVAPID